jgi:hypothetical protein
MKYEINDSVESLYEWGVRLEMERRSITLDDTQWSRNGNERTRVVTVHYRGTRESYRRAWSIARRLIHSNRSRPAQIFTSEIDGIMVETAGPFAYTLRESIEWATTPCQLTYRPADPPIPALHAGPPLRLMWPSAHAA